MKKYTLLLFILVALSQGALAQKDNDFTIELSAPEIEIKAGESREITINLTRFKGYNKAKAKLGVSTLPAGVTLSYEPQEGVIHSSLIKINVAGETQPGTYTLVTTCTMNHKSKGTMLKLMVAESTAEAASKSN